MWRAGSALRPSGPWQPGGDLGPATQPAQAQGPLVHACCNCLGALRVGNQGHWTLDPLGSLGQLVSPAAWGSLQVCADLGVELELWADFSVRTFSDSQEDLNEKETPTGGSSPMLDLPGNRVPFPEKNQDPVVHTPHSGSLGLLEGL